MNAAFNNIPKIAFVFGDMTGGGHNLQAYKTILYSGAKENCIAITLSKGEDCQLERLLNDAGIKVYYVPFSMKNPFSGLKKLKKLVQNHECKIVHSNGLKSDLACHYAFVRTQVKHVITLHNYLKEDAFLRMNKWKASIAVTVQKQLLKSCKHIIACSKTLERQMLEDNPKLNIVAIQNGVDVEVFSPKDKRGIRAEYDIPADKIIFISTGRLNPRKRIVETAEAFLSAKLDNMHELWFVGNGECFDEYSRQFGSYENIKFWGRRNDIVALLNMADVFVSSSETEGLPLAVLEAISTGKKVYLSDIPQHTEILNDLPEAGYTYHLGEKQELARLFKLTSAQINDRKSCNVVISNTPFDIKVMGEKYAQYYRSLD